MITLRGITWDHPRGYQPLAASIKPYFQKTGVKIEWDKRSLKDFGDAPLDVLAERYDLLIIDHPHVGFASATGCLLPLDGYIDAGTLATLAAESAGPSHASYFYDVHQWGLAIDTAMQASVYRPDLVVGESPGSDLSWDDVLEMADHWRKMNRFVAIPLVPTDCICSFITLCASFGDPPSLRGSDLVSDEVGLKALKYLRDLLAGSHPDCLKWNPIALLDHMSHADDVAYCPLTFCYTNYSREGYAPHKLRFTNIPGGAKGSILGGTGFAVSARCEHPAEACAYGVWLCSAEIQRTLYVENGGQPGNIMAWKDQHANQIVGDFFYTTTKTLEAAYVRPRHNGYPIFQEEAGNVIHAMLRDGTAIEACLATLRTLYHENLPGGAS